MGLGDHCATSMAIVGSKISPSRAADICAAAWIRNFRKEATNVEQTLQLKTSDARQLAYGYVI